MAPSEPRTTTQRTGLWLGLGLFGLLLLMPEPAGFGTLAWRAAALGG